MSQAPHGSERFVPSGVDAQSWIGFEKRIQERRYRALLGSIQASIAREDGIGARIALEEARELRPDSEELDEVASRVALLPVVIPATSGGYLGSRTFGAVGLLLVGVALLVALDFMRPLPPVEPLPVAAPLPADTVSPELRSVAADRDALPLESSAEESIASGMSAETTEDSEIVGTAGPVASRAELELDAPPPAPVIRRALQPAIFIERSTPLPDAALEARGPAGEPGAEVIAPLPRRDVLIPTPPPTPQVARSASAAPERPPVVESAPPVPDAAPPSRVPDPPVAAAAPVAAPVRPDESRVALTLNRYAQAYASLDAGAAAQVWPTVDRRALARAFAALESQSVSFDDCSIDVHGETADASCRGNHSWLGKVGARETRTEPREWRFELRRDGDAWTIESARTLLQ